MDNLNIYEYFNSKDIADHCKNIGHAFTAIETAYLIWYSDHHTIAQKHNAWRHIIEIIPDEEITQFSSASSMMLHEFLQKYMDVEQAFVDDFTITKQGCIYSYESRYREWDEYHGDGYFFDNFDAAAEAAKEDIENEEGRIVEVRIIRRVLNRSHKDCDFGKKVLALTTEMEPLRIDEADTDEQYQMLGCCYGFYDMWVEIPTPFQKGDVVCVHNTYGEKTEPLALSRIPYWTECELGRDYTDVVNRLRKWGDWSDMQVSYWRLDEKGNLLTDHGPEYLSLEFYCGELKGRSKFLIALKHYLRKQIGINDLIRSYATFGNKDCAECFRGCTGKVEL